MQVWINTVYFKIKIVSFFGSQQLYPLHTKKRKNLIKILLRLNCEKLNQKQEPLLLDLKKCTVLTLGFLLCYKICWGRVDLFTIRQQERRSAF